ncbi:TRAP transporter small permease [Chloroflexota bacterium]
MRDLALGFRALLRALELLSTLIERILTASGLVFLLAMWGLLLTNTVGRWLFETCDWRLQTGWCLELVGYMIPWTIFFMLGPVAKWNMHIKVTYFPSKLLGERRGATFSRMLENMTGLAVCTFLSIHSYRWIIDTINDPLGSDIPSVGGWSYPLEVIYSAVFVGLVATSYYYFHEIVKWIVSLAAQEEQAGEPVSGTATQEK